MEMKEILHLKREFERIKNMGYVKSTRTGFTGVGKTFEDLLGKFEDTLSEPDYHGIEIKTKRAYSKSYTTLFNATPKGSEDYEIKRLCSTYGYPDKIFRSSKVLANSFYANHSTLVRNCFLFKLHVDYESKKIRLLVTDRDMNLLDNSTYWNFDTIKEKLERKLSVLAFVKAWPKTLNGILYYKYYEINFYKLKSFLEFLKLIENGTIRITFKIGIYREGARKGEIHDKGTGFEIKEADLQKLFDLITI